MIARRDGKIGCMDRSVLMMCLVFVFLRLGTKRTDLKTISYVLISTTNSYSSLFIFYTCLLNYTLRKRNKDPFVSIMSEKTSFCYPDHITI